MWAWGPVESLVVLAVVWLSTRRFSEELIDWQLAVLGWALLFCVCGSCIKSVVAPVLAAIYSIPLIAMTAPLQLIVYRWIKARYPQWHHRLKNYPRVMRGGLQK